MEERKHFVFMTWHSIAGAFREGTQCPVGAEQECGGAGGGERGGRLAASANRAHVSSI